MSTLKQRLMLQLFAEGAGDGGGSGEGGGTQAAATGDTSAPDAGEARLRALGVPEAALEKNRAKRVARAAAKAPQGVQAAQNTTQQAAAAETSGDHAGDNTPPAQSAEQGQAAPHRMTWEEIKADPEYNGEMQKMMKARLKEAGVAQESMKALTPAIELLAQHYGMDAEKLDAAELAQRIMDDNAYYEDKALELGVSVDLAKQIERNERETARLTQERAEEEQRRVFDAHVHNLMAQGEELKKVFPSFDFWKEMENPHFKNMTSPGGGMSVEDAYYAIHHREIQAASLQAAQQRTAKQMANAIRSGASRPVESGTSTTTAPSVTNFNYAAASREKREALKRQIYEAAARGEKIYPGQV